jgi:hypothetical protein
MSRFQALQDRLSAIEAQLPVRPAHQAPPRPAVARRHDTADRVSPVLQQLLTEVLPGSLVLDWRQDGATHGGRMAADGLVYRFRIDATGISYRPAWDAVGERGWQLRSDSFLQLRAPEARTKQQGRRRRLARQDEQRVAPRSAVGRGHLQRLQRLAGRRDNTDQLGAASSLMKPDLRVATNLQRVEALLHHPTAACFLRTGRLPKHAITSPSTEPGTLRAMAPQEIAVDPVRFQFKAGASPFTGVVKPVRPSADWDPLRAGVLSVWKDPRNGMVFVVNGHHRLEMAKQSNAPQVIVRFLNTTDSLEARAIGALQNIASGTSSAADAEAFFRSNPGVTPVGLQLLGLETGLAAPRPRTDAEPLTLEQRLDSLKGRARGASGERCGRGWIAPEKDCQVTAVQTTPSGPRKWGGRERQFAIQLEEPIVVDGLRTNRVRGYVGALPEQISGGRARQLEAAGLLPRLGGAGEQKHEVVDLMFGVGTDQIYPDVDRLELPPKVARTVAQRVRTELKAIISQIPDGQLVSCTAWSQDGGGARRRAIYERAGFQFAGDDPGAIGLAVVRNGRLSRITPQRADSTMTQGKEIDVEGMVFELLTLKSGNTQLAGSGNRWKQADSLLHRLDALKRKCKTGYGCGSACISLRKECRSAPRSSTSKERMRRLLAVAGGGATAQRGVAPVRSKEAGQLASDIAQRRGRQAAELRGARQQGKGKTPDTFTSDEAIALQVLANRKLKSDRAREAEMVRLGVKPGTDMVQLVGRAREKLGGKDWWKHQSGWKDKLKRFAAAAADPKNSRPDEPVLAAPAQPGAPGFRIPRPQQAGASRPAAGASDLTAREQRLLDLAVQNLPGAEPATTGATPKPGGLADAMRQSVEAMKAADARQFGMLAQQLFEISWNVDRNKRFRGMTKEQAMESYKQEFAAKLSAQAQQPRPPVVSPVPAGGKPRSLAETLKATTEAMKASDRRLEQLTSDVINLRAASNQVAPDGGPATRQVGGKRRSQLNPGTNRPRSPRRS